MEFAQEWDKFLQRQIQTAKGARLERLRKELAGEKKMFQEVLWPVFQTFEGFTLEYELLSTSGAVIYMDAFYEPLRMVFESDGFVPHAANITRDRFAFERMRIRTVAMYGYKYIPFAWDELDQRPKQCQRAVFELLGRYSGSADRAIRDLHVYERELIRFMLHRNRPVSLGDVRYCLNLGEDASRNVVRKLVEKQLIRPSGHGRKKIRAYRLDERAIEYFV